MPNYASLLLALLTFSTAAHAYTREDLLEAVDVLEAQLEKIDKLGGRTCPDEHKKLNTAKELRISLFAGYENYDDVTADAIHSAAVATVLKKKCKGHIAACGFVEMARGANKVKLQRVIDGRKVTIELHHTSVSEVDAENSNFGKQQWNQYAHSQTTWTEFHRALQKSDIVFYSGHSRVGSGLGFNIESLPQHAFNMVFKQPLNATLDALRARPSRLKVLGLFSCESDKYYREVMEQANPNMNLIVTHIDLDASPGEQSEIGALNALLKKQCHRTMVKALLPVMEPIPGGVEYIRRPE